VCVRVIDNGKQRLFTGASPQIVRSVIDAVFSVRYELNFYIKCRLIVAMTGLNDVIMGRGVLHCTGVVYFSYRPPAIVFSWIVGIDDSLMYVQFGSTAS
jgi:hypothetical protein